MKGYYGGKLKRELRSESEFLAKGTWIYGNLIYEEIGKYYIHVIGSRRQKVYGLNMFIAHEVEPGTVVSWTGKRDVNGERIYSGMVVKVRYIGGGERIGVIIPYDCGMYGLQTMGEDHTPLIEDLLGDGEGTYNEYAGIEGLEVVGHELDMPEVWEQVGGRESKT